MVYVPPKTQARPTKAKMNQRNTIKSVVEKHGKISQLVPEVISLEDDDNDDDSGIVCEGETDVGYRKDVGDWYCSRCCRTYHLPGAYRTHMATAKHTYGPHLYVKGSYGCLICKEIFASPRYLLDHKKQSHSYCDKCGLCFQDPAAFMEHQVSKHPTYGIYGSASSLCCNICGKKCLSQRVLDKHVKSHEEMLKEADVTVAKVTDVGLTDEKRFSCDSCPRKYKTLKQLQDHALKHDASQSKYCHQCDMSFHSQHTFDGHMSRGYHKEKDEKGRLNCDGCERFFFKMHEIRIHEQRCMARKKILTLDSNAGTFNAFICDKCPRKYSTADALSRHKNRHRSKYYCYKCDFTLTSFVYARHMENGYHKERNKNGELTCDGCGKVWGNFQEVRRHEEKCVADKEAEVEAEADEVEEIEDAEEVEGKKTRQ